MIVSDTAVKKSTTIVVLCLLLIVIGIYSYLVLPRESEPDITIPNVFISTSYRGVSARDIETSITIEIEKKLKGLDGLKKIKSVSSEGLSSISVEFITGTDISEALVDVKDKVDEALGKLPSDLENDPSVFEVNISEMPIIVFSLSGTCGLPYLKKIGDELKDDIEAIKGVLEVDVAGGREREIRIELDPDKLAHYGLNIGTFQRIVNSENQNTSGGAIRLGNGRFQLRVPGEFVTPEEIFGLVLATHQGEPVYLKDVADVSDGFKEERSRSRLNGRNAVTISVKKRSGENIIGISKKVDTLVEQKRTTWAAGTKITKILDKSHDIRVMVADLENNILSGLILVLVVIFFAMGFRNAMLVSLAIPFSMMLSFSVLHLLDITLNMVVLFSLTLALGMLVDNAIVIVENAYRFMEQGAGKVEAAMKATSEVAYPVIGSTLTTIAAFFPMLFWPGVIGEFMSYLPLTLIITLLSSLFVALVINPALISIFMKVKGASHSATRKSLDEINRQIEKPVEIKGILLKNYTWILSRALNTPLAIIGIGFCLLFLMFEGWFLTIGIEKPIEFLPDVDPKRIYINADVPEGADMDYIERILQRLEFAVSGIKIAPDGTPADPTMTSDRALAGKKHKTLDNKDRSGPSDLKNIKSVYMKGIISSGGSSAFSANAPNHLGISFVDMKERSRSSKTDVEEIRKRIQYIPGGKITIEEEKEGPPTGSPINIEISGKNFAVLGEISQKIKDILETIPHVEDVRDDFVEGIPSVQVIVDRQKAALFGMTTEMIGFALKSAYNGLEVSSFHEENDDYDITVQLKEEDRRIIDILHQLMLPTPSGELVPLSTIARIAFSGSIGNINRINNKRVVTVQANVDETKIPGPVARAEAEKILATFPLPPGYTITFTGEFEFQQESESFLTRAFLVALLLIFLILVSMFDSISQPFIIMTSVILSLGGVFLGLTLFTSPFGIIMTGVGVISLAGVVVNNAIVLIDYTNKLRDRGYTLKDAVIAAGATRMRPVLLTAATTILGLIPMITGISFDFHTGSISWVSESSQWWKTMAIVVVFGLILATFLTLVVVPALYYLNGQAGSMKKRLFIKLKQRYWQAYPVLAGLPVSKKQEK